MLRLKCTKFHFRRGSGPDPALGAYSASPDPLAVFKGPTSKGRAGEEKRGREREGREGPGPSRYFGIERPLCETVTKVSNC